MPIPYSGIPCLALIWGRVMVLLQVGMPDQLPKEGLNSSEDWMRGAKRGGGGWENGRKGELRLVCKVKINF